MAHAREVALMVTERIRAWLRLIETELGVEMKVEKLLQIKRTKKRKSAKACNHSKTITQLFHDWRKWCLPEYITVMEKLEIDPERVSKVEKWWTGQIKCEYGGHLRKLCSKVECLCCFVRSLAFFDGVKSVRKVDPRRVIRNTNENIDLECPKCLHFFQCQVMR